MVELKITQAETRERWACYVEGADVVCGGTLVAQIPGSPSRYYCADHLLDAIRIGELSLHTAGSAVQTTLEDADSAPGEVHGSVTLPVTTHDDGSVSVGDIDIRW